MLKSFLRLRYKSFGFAIKGFKYLWKEDNFKIHILALVLLISLSIFFEISRTEWLFVILASTLVILSEAVNTAIEKTLDFIKNEQDQRIGAIKDMSAAFVLIAAISALAIGLIIFLPKLLNW